MAQLEAWSHAGGAALRAFARFDCVGGGGEPSTDPAKAALREARAGGWGSEKMARTAVIVGWGGIVLGLLPLCMAMTMSGAQLGYSLCNDLLQVVSDVMGGR